VGRRLEDIVGQPVFEAFPASPDTLDEEGVPRIKRSFERARDTGRIDTMPLQKYDIPDPTTGGMSERWWSLISVPVVGPDGEVALVAQRAEDVTDWVRDRQAGDVERQRSERLSRRVQEVEADLYARAHELQAALALKEEAAARVASLAAVAMELTGADSVEDLSRIIFSRGLPVLGADGGAISVRDDEAAVVRLTVSESLGDHVQVAYAELPLDSPLPAAHVARTGEAVLLPTVASGLAWSELTAQVYEATQRRAWATLPLRVGGRLIGALVASWVDEREFTVDDVAMMEGFAAQVAQALRRISAAAAERASAAAAARLSEALQRSLLTEPPQPDELVIAVRYEPAAQEAQVGGDWYDAFLTESGSTLLVIGDVTGHDRTAAAAMAQIRNVLRGIAVDSTDPPAALLTRLDRAAHRLGIDALATALLVRVEGTPGQRRIRWSNAGHPPAVLRHPDGTATVLDAEPDLLLGMDRHSPRTDHVTDLPDGSLLVLFTDGLVERRGYSIDVGIKRVVDAVVVLDHVDAGRAADAVVAAGEQSHEDDIAVLVVQAGPTPS
ncbi:MAG: SpoIIE family protein phosphatase, partial [Actinomycetes bacterium]